MGKSTKKTEAINPKWVTSGVEGLMGKIGQLGDTDPLSYVAGSNSLLDKAQSSLLGGLNPQIAEMLTAAGGGGSVSATGASDYYDKYKNPWENDVVNTSLADFDVGAGRQTAQADLDLAGAGAFNGSGSAITKSMLGGELARGRGALSAGIRSDGFSKAMGLGSQDADRFLQASTANAQFADAAAGRKLQAAGLLGNLEDSLVGRQLTAGDMMRQIEQQRLQAPISLLSTQAGLTGSLPLNLFNGSKTTQSGGTLGAIGSGLLGLGSILAMPATGGLSSTVGGGLAKSFFSDERLKTGVEHIGTRPDGLGVYVYRYLWSPIRFVGVMAQEVLRVKPHAVQTHESGFLMVNYGAL